MKLSDFKPRRTRLTNRRERLQLLVIALAGLYEDLVTILTLGFYTTETRAEALFSWFEED